VPDLDKSAFDVTLKNSNLATAMIVSKQTPSEFPKTACGGTLKNTAGYPTATYCGQVVYFCTSTCLYAYEENKDRFMANEIEQDRKSVV
jgi:YHS domain-containing protein